MKQSLKFACFCLCLLAFFSSCSLNYDSQKEERVTAPDFHFENLKMTKVENGNVTVSVESEVLEQYNSTDMAFAKNVFFRLFNKNHLINVEGECEYLSIDSKNEIYTLFNDISVTSYDQNMKITSDGLKWNNKTEQLTSPKNGLVTVSNDVVRNGKNYVEPEKQDSNSMTFSGTDFSASGVTKTYSFGKKIRGRIVTGDSNDKK